MNPIKSFVIRWPSIALSILGLVLGIAVAALAVFLMTSTGFCSVNCDKYQAAYTWYTPVSFSVRVVVFFIFYGLAASYVLSAQKRIHEYLDVPLRDLTNIQKSFPLFSMVMGFMAAMKAALYLN